MSVATTPARSSRPLSELAALVEALAARPQEWIERVRFRVGERWYERLDRSADHEVWAISWMPGQATPAVSIHTYSPPLSIMNRYELGEAGLVPCGTVFEESGDAGDLVAREPAASRGSEATASRNIDEVMDAARARLPRVSPEQAYEALGAGAVLVDIRPAAQRAHEGAIPGAILVERNVLEWRFDPASDARLPIANGYSLHVIVVCSAGYASSLAAASLQDVGLFRATDLIGGFQAWRAAGLPTMSGSLAGRVNS